MWSSVLPKSATAHQTVTHWLWRGRSWCCRGFALAQNWKFCLFTKPDKWKWASSLQSRWPGGTFANIVSQAACLSCQSRSWSSWTIIILYGWNFKSRCRILRTLRSDTPKASAAERCGDVVTACLTVVMVSGVCTLRGLPGDFCFIAEVCRKCISTAIWFFCLALFCASLCQNECETDARQQSRNLHIWNRSPSQTHDAQYSRPCWQLKWQSLCYSKTHDSNVFYYYSGPGGQLKMGMSFCRILYITDLKSC